MPNGNVLIAESFGDSVVEVTGEPRPRIVWEYVNLIGERDGRRIAGVLGQAKRFASGELTFLGAPTISRRQDRKGQAAAVSAR